MKIFLIRHGDAIRTETDIVLTKKGRIQAKKVAKMLYSLPITKVYVSTVRRAQQTKANKRMQYFENIHQGDNFIISKVEASFY